MLSNSEESLAQEFEKLATKPTGGKNWCDLPYELKQECMKWMDLPTKFRMRRTGRMEKEIFDKIKFFVDVFEIVITDKIKLGIKDNGKTWTLLSDDVVPVDTVVKCAAFLLKSAENIGEVVYSGPKSSSIVRSLLAELEQCESFRFSRFDFASDSSIDVPLCLLEKCSVPLKCVDGSCTVCYHVDRFLTVLQFNTARFLIYDNLMENRKGLEFCIEMALKWIENDAPIGNKAVVNHCGSPGFVSEFAERFADRFVAQNRSSVRIRTDNPGKHIVFRSGHWSEQEIMKDEED